MSKNFITSHPTPGPWKWIGGTRDMLVTFTESEIIMISSKRVTQDGRQSADARLISAAPELLDQLKLAVMILYKHDPHAPDLVAMKHAIAKAEGR